MTKFTRLIASLAITTLAMTPLLRGAHAQESQSPLTIINGDVRAHVFPTWHVANTVNQFIDTGPLLYHSGGSVMPRVTIYAIFWVPPTLQTGAPTSMSASYQNIQKNLLTDYPGHSIDNNNTQYFQIIGTKTFIKNAGSFGGFFVDTRPYPASGCTDSATPGNCLSDLQLQREVKRAMTLNGWTGGLNHIFLVYTSRFEGSCLDSLGHCAYTFYCGYHNAITSGVTAPIIYSNEPFAETSVCQAPGAPSPNGDAFGDAAATVASHEVTEAITDPLLNAWFTAQGNEIGDLCAYNYGSLTWDGGLANEVWNGDPYLLQQEYDNHVGGCVQVGP